MGTTIPVRPRHDHRFFEHPRVVGGLSALLVLIIVGAVTGELIGRLLVHLVAALLGAVAGDGTS